MANTQYVPNVKGRYLEKAVPEMMKKFGYRNVMQVPHLVKINVNMGVGDAISDAKLLEAAAKDLGTITGQRPATSRSKAAIAGFKLRAGIPIGCHVTLRHRRMYEFFDRLVNVAIPRIRDFRGLSPKSFDGRGNYSFGVKEHIIFPEIDYDKVLKVMGMDVTIVTTAKTDEEARELLALLGMPFRQA
ncbi:MAG: 50S ribosomal protein L5 [Candidatus Latescibacterota bacterium]|jgi:large subunit ribosomal protein L5|nr:MAG: 50S ribosomal protein L5 [Candidatus Latescibacterota bacterium]